MDSLSANDAKTHFGELLLRVQREPIQITRNGKEVAVMVSMQDFLRLQQQIMQPTQEKE